MKNLICLLIISCLTGCTKTAVIETDPVQGTINLSAEYLSSCVKSDGTFEYRVNMDPSIKIDPGYNILRHAGSIYAMSTYYQLQPDDKMKDLIELAGKYLRDVPIYPLSEREDLLAVWSEPEVNKTGKPLQAKLGGTGLGLVALLSIEKIHPGFTPISDLQALGRFIVFMQKENGSFCSKYIPSTGGQFHEWHSLYYPGEAALGLIMLYEKDPSEIWINSAIKALTYLAHSRKNRTYTPADHWALLATEKLFSIENIDKLPVSKELLIKHAIQICDTILHSQIKNHEKHEYIGGFSNDGRTTPSATRLEGLQAALSFLPSGLSMRKDINVAVSRGISFLMNAQIKKGEFIGAFPRATGKVDKDLPGAESFNRRSTELRIDYTQHALSAMIQYLHQTGLRKIN